MRLHAAFNLDCVPSHVHSRYLVYAMVVCEWVTRILREQPAWIVKAPLLIRHNALISCLSNQSNALFSLRSAFRDKLEAMPQHLPCLTSSSTFSFAQICCQRLGLCDRKNHLMVAPNSEGWQLFVSPHSSPRSSLWQPAACSGLGDSDLFSTHCTHTRAKRAL